MTVIMKRASGFLSCVQRLTSSFVALRKSSIGFQISPVLAACKRFASQEATLKKSSALCSGHGKPPLRSIMNWWPFVSTNAAIGMLPNPLSVSIPVRGMASLYQMHRTGPHFKLRKKRRPLDGNPFMKGVVLKTLIKKPKKPNSANRRCVLVRLSNGKEAVAHVPGEGHNLQEHNIVLTRVGRLQDVPGVRLKVVRGKYDCAEVIKRNTG